MKGDHKVCCILCKRSEETRVTGALSSKENVTAHQNCLLFASGTFCENSPQEDDLFGFSVADVLREVKRGKKLKCSYCHGIGATSGCELKLCKKTYHYPCAIEDEAQPFEDEQEGKYGIHCSKHLGLQKNNGSVNGHTSSVKKRAAPRNPNEAGTLKVYCLTCENKEGKVPLDSLSNKKIMSYCEKHAPSSHRDTAAGESSGVGSSVRRSDTNSSRSKVSKRPMSSDEEEEVHPVRNKSTRRTIDSKNPFQSAHEVITNTGTLLFAPIEDDDCSETDSTPDGAPVRNKTDSPGGSGSNQGLGNQAEWEGGDRDEDGDDTIIHSDAESQSLLASVVCISSYSITELSPQPESAPEKAEERKEKESRPEQNPAHSPDRQTAAPSVPHHSSTPSPRTPKPGSVSSPRPRSIYASKAPPEPVLTSLVASTHSPKSPPADEDCAPEPDPEPAPEPDPKPAINSTSFWKNCNVAGCTQAMFSDFMKEMNEISERIQSEQASKTDYDRALKVMASSGQLEKLVTKQQEDLQRKQRELEKAAAAMSEVLAALKR